MACPVVPCQRLDKWVVAVAAISLTPARGQPLHYLFQTPAQRPSEKMLTRSRAPPEEREHAKCAIRLARAVREGRSAAAAWGWPNHRARPHRRRWTGRA